MDLYLHTFFFTCSVPEWEGETLEITRISRLGMGAYLCIASNGVPPAVSKQIKVSVDCEYKFPFIFCFCNLCFFFMCIYLCSLAHVVEPLGKCMNRKLFYCCSIDILLPGDMVHEWININAIEPGKISIIKCWRTEVLENARDFLHLKINQLGSQLNSLHLIKWNYSK